jgi:integrase
LAAKKATEARKAPESRKTFGTCATEHFESKQKAWRNDKHKLQWLSHLSDHAASIWDMPIDVVSTEHVLKVLQPLWIRLPATAPRIRGRIEAVLDSAKAKGLRTGENPAAWRGHLALILPGRPKLSRPHHAALAYREVPAFIAKLAEFAAPHALALEFLILTAARSNEVLGALWEEIDVDARVWTIPAGRMKAGVEHRVPLSARAVEIVEKQAAIRSNEFIFPGHRNGRPLSAASLRLLRPAGATVHGLRSSFRDWAGEETQFAREIAEAALAHSSGDATERAYRRGDALEKRRQLMEAWARFCERGPAANVVQISAKITNAC